MIYIRSLFFNVLFYGWLALMCITLSLIFFLPQNWVACVANCFFLKILRVITLVVGGIKIEVRGRQFLNPKSKAIYAIKHQSALETYIMTSFITNATMIMKKELAYIPIFGWAQAAYGLICVDRGGSGASMKKMLKDAKKMINKGRSIIIFPEGTRTKPGTKTIYKPGLVFMADNLDVPVIPVALNTGLFWAKHSFLRYKGTVIIEFLEPMPKGLAKADFMQELENRIESKCKEINNESAAKYPHAKKILDQNMEQL